MRLTSILGGMGIIAAGWLGAPVDIAASSQLNWRPLPAAFAAPHPGMRGFRPIRPPQIPGGAASRPYQPWGAPAARLSGTPGGGPGHYRMSAVPAWPDRAAPWRPPFPLAAPLPYGPPQADARPVHAAQPLPLFPDYRAEFPRWRGGAPGAVRAYVASAAPGSRGFTDPRFRPVRAGMMVRPIHPQWRPVVGANTWSPRAALPHRLAHGADAPFSPATGGSRSQLHLPASGQTFRPIGHVAARPDPRFRPLPTVPTRQQGHDRLPTAAHPGARRLPGWVSTERLGLELPGCRLCTGS